MPGEEVQMNTELANMDARMKALEHILKLLYGRTEELARDLNISFKQAASYQINSEQKIDARLDKLEARYKEIDARMDRVDVDLRVIQVDMAAMEVRIVESNKADIRAVANDMAEMETHLLTDMEEMETRLLTDIGAVRSDMANMEKRIMDAFKQMLVIINPQFSPPQA